VPVKVRVKGCRRAYLDTTTMAGVGRFAGL